jgi:hypothetical protein
VSRAKVAKNSKGVRLGGRGKGTPNKATKTAREIILSIVDNLTPQVQEKFDQLDPKDWLAAYMKLIEFAVPKISPVQSPESIEDRPDVVIRV